MTANANPVSPSRPPESVQGAVAVVYDLARSRRKHPYTGPLQGMGLAGVNEAGRYVPFRRAPRQNYLADDTMAAIRLLADSPRVYFDAIRGRFIEMRHRLPLAETWDDVRVMGALLEISSSCELQDLDKALLEPFPDGARRSRAAVARCTEDAATIIGVFFDMADLPGQIHQQGLEAVYNLELSVVDPTISMIANGVKASSVRLAEHIDAYNGQVRDYRDRICELAGDKMNPKSERELTKFLYRELRLPIIHRTRNGNPSLDKRTLKRLIRCDKTGAAALVLQFQEAAMLQLNAARLITSVDFQTGRIHAELDPLGAATGRYACRNPPVQAIPGALLDSFVAEKDYVLVEADYSQIELRVLAHLSQDPVLLEAFCKPGAAADIHRRTAAVALGIPENQVTAEQRNHVGKKVNFGLAYGLTEFGLAEELEIPVAEAQKFIERFFDRHRGVRRWIYATEMAAQLDGVVRTLYGRRRTLPDAKSCEGGDLEHALRQAVNHIVQGTAADILKMAIARVHRALPPDCLMVMTQHDSILFEVPRGHVRRSAQVIREAMEEPPPDFSVPLKVEIRGGRTWARCKTAALIA